MTTENYSVHEANKLLRVLEGKPLKFTVRVHLPDGSKVEFQTEKPPKIKWNDEARELWLHQGDYEAKPVMAWVTGSILLTEENKQ